MSFSYRFTIAGKLIVVEGGKKAETKEWFQKDKKKKKEEAFT